MRNYEFTVTNGSIDTVIEQIITFFSTFTSETGQKYVIDRLSATTLYLKPMLWGGCTLYKNALEPTIKIVVKPMGHFSLVEVKFSLRKPVEVVLRLLLLTIMLVDAVTILFSINGNFSVLGSLVINYVLFFSLFFTRWMIKKPINYVCYRLKTTFA